MTVSELIKELLKVEDKSIIVRAIDELSGYPPFEIEQVRTSKYSILDSRNRVHKHDCIEMSRK